MQSFNASLLHHPQILSQEATESYNPPKGKNKEDTGTSLVVQWLRLHIYNAGDLGSIPGQGTGSHMPQLRVHTPQLKIPRAAAKTEDPKCHN